MSLKNANKNQAASDKAPIVATNIAAPANATSNHNKLNSDEIVATASLKEQRELKQADANHIFVACSLPHGITFTGLRSTTTGAYSFPGINNKPQGGILAGPGGSILVKTPIAVWQEIKTRYQSASVFAGELPMLREFKNVNDYEDAIDELSQVRTGVEQIDSTKSSGTVS